MSGPVDLLDQLDALREKAYDEVIRLCKGGRWTMRVPVDEKRDSDTVIVAALDAVPVLTSALRAVLDVHRPREQWGEVDCIGCREGCLYCEADHPWPCETVEAVTAALAALGGTDSGNEQP